MQGKLRKKIEVLSSDVEKILAQAFAHQKQFMHSRKVPQNFGQASLLKKMKIRSSLI